MCFFFIQFCTLYIFNVFHEIHGSLNFIDDGQTDTAANLRAYRHYKMYIELHRSVTIIILMQVLYAFYDLQDNAKKTAALNH